MCPIGPTFGLAITAARAAVIDLLSRLKTAVALGVVAAGLLVLLARRHGRRGEPIVYGAVLVLIAWAYLLFGLRRGAPFELLAVEAVGGLLYSSAALVGIMRWPFLLGVGWSGHVVWDLFLHHADGLAFAPQW